jgi:autotransporter-associated beta strand protein
MKITRRPVLLFLAALLITSVSEIVSAQSITLSTSTSSSSSSNGWGKGGKPKPTPTPAPTPKPVDGRTDWTGTTNSDFNTGTNWSAVTGSAPPVAGDVAWFTSSPANKTVNLSASVSIAGLYFNGTGASGYSLTNSNSAAFTLTANGTVIGTETGDGTAVTIGAENTTGTNTISAPITLAPSSGTSTIYQEAGGELSISGVISGLGITLSKTGGGILTLSGANTYSGGTTLNSGTLQLGSSSTGSITSGPVGTGTLTLNAGTLSSDSTTARSIANPITFGGDVTFGTSTNFGALTLSGAGTLTDNRTLTFIADVTYSGNIGESGGPRSLTKAGTGTLILSGINTYSGGTTLSDGLLQLNSSSALGSSSGSLTVNGGILDLDGQNISVGSLSGSGGTIWNNGPLAGTGTVTLTIGTGNAGGGNYAGVIQDNNPSSNAGKVALTKTGTGTITLSGINLYTGVTTVNGGKLFINGDQTAATGTTTVNNSGSVLGGTGTIGSAVTLASSGAILEAGTGLTTQTLTVKGALTQSTTGSILSLALGASGTHSTLALTGASSSSFYLTQHFSFIDVGATTGAYDNIITGVSSPVVTTGWQIDNAGWIGVFTYDALNSAIDLNLTAVPEPSTWFAGGLAFAALLISQRRRVASLLTRA